MAIFRDGDLILQRRSCKDNDLILAELAEIFCKIFRRMYGDGCVCIQLRDPRSCDNGPRLADIFWMQKKLGREIRGGGWYRIEEGKGLDTSECNVLCCGMLAVVGT